MHFYDKFLLLCAKKNTAPSRAAIEMGINKGTVSVWKSKYNQGKQVTPSSPIIAKMAEYFGVDMNYLMDETNETYDHVATDIDDKLADIPEKERQRLIKMFNGDKDRAYAAYWDYETNEFAKKSKDLLPSKNDTDDLVKFALFGKTEIDDETYESVKEFAKFAAEQKRKKREGK